MTSFVDSDISLFTTATTAFTAPRPTDGGALVEGDLIWVQIQWNSASATAITPPSGWTAVISPVVAGSAAFAVYYHFVTAGEAASPPANWAFTMAASVPGNVIAGRFRGVDQSTPLDVALQVATNGTATKTVPQVTTVTPNTFVISGACLQSATTATLTEPAGFAVAESSVGAGAGRAGVLAVKGVQAGVGGSGTAVWTQSTALQGYAYQVALRASGASPATGTWIRRWVGAPLTSGFTVAVRTTGASSVRLKVATNAGLTTAVTYSTAVAPTADGWSKHVIAGLTPGTTYYYGVEMDGTVSTALTAAVRTLPTGNSFTVGFASCLNNGSTSRTVFDQILAAEPDFFTHLGDFHYADISTADPTAFRSAVDGQITGNAGLADLLSRIPTTWQSSDHDSGTNNWSPGPGVQTSAFNSTYREMAPHFPLETSDGVYFTFVVGRVRFIALDSRSYRSANSATDNTSKTMLGATQKAWLKARLIDPEPLKVILMDVPWIETATAGSDKWGGFTTERTEIATYVATNSVKAVILHGDAHMLAADDGTNSPGGMPVLCASPLSQTTSLKGGPYSQSTYPLSGGVGATGHHFGLVTFADNGSQIVVTYSGRDDTNTERIALTKTYTTSSSSTASAAASATGALTATTFRPGFATADMTATGALVATPTSRAGSVPAAMTGSGTVTASTGVVAPSGSRICKIAHLMRPEDAVAVGLPNRVFHPGEEVTLPSTSASVLVANGVAAYIDTVTPGGTGNGIPDGTVEWADLSATLKAMLKGQIAFPP